jgi:hypothetical protein
MKHIVLIAILMVASFVGINADVSVNDNLVLPTITQIEDSSAPSFLNGEVVVELKLDKHGNVVLVNGYEGDYFLKSYAEEVVTDLLVFTPTYKDGAAVPSTVKLPLIF